MRHFEWERYVWADHDSTDSSDRSLVKPTSLPSTTKPATRTISLRLPEAMLENLKMLASNRDVPYHSLLKMYLAERIEEELRILR